jgi:hypothetical protein
MALRDMARPLEWVSSPAQPEVKPLAVPIIPADPRQAFTPANRPNGWRKAVKLYEQQRRLQEGK